MNRCLRALSALTLLVALPLGSMAQTSPTAQVITDRNGNSVTVRTFPSTAVRGTLQVVQPPVGQTLQVMTVLDSQSMLHDVWVLNETEVALYPTKPSYSR